MHDAGIATLQAAVRRHGLDLDAYRALGDIRAVAWGDAILFTYTDKAQYADRWNDVERSARGLIIQVVTGTVLALPWAKFFNLEQRDGARLDDLPAGPIEVTDKLDGSLIVGWWDTDRWRFTTRGSFTSEQAVWARQWAAAHLDLRGIPHNLTLLFEAIYPANRIVVDYGDRQGLILIGARWLGSGVDVAHAGLGVLAEAMTVSLVPVTTLPSLRHVEEYLTRAESATGIEGWVMRFTDGTRVKLKTAEYLRLHRLISRLTPAVVRDALAADALDDLVGSLPDEFHGEVRAMAAEIDRRAMVTLGRAVALHERTRAMTTDRKGYALSVQHSPYKHLAFRLLDEKPVLPSVMKDVDLTGLDGLGTSITSLHRRMDG